MSFLRKWAAATIVAAATVTTGASAGVVSAAPALPAAPTPRPAQDTTTYTVKPGDYLYGIARATGTPINTLLSLNGLTLSSVIYPGQTLKVLAGGSSTPSPTPSTPPSTGTGTYTVVAGDSLYGIARKTGTPINTLLSLNGLSLSSVIRPGQVLKIAGSGGGSTPAPAPTPSPTPATGTYTVVRGDYLYGIATKTGTPLATLLSLNGLTLSSTIYPGQVLKIASSGGGSTPAPAPAPSPTPATGTYTVVRGDSLYGIASKTGTPINTLLALNGLTLSSVIQPGQVLKISGTAPAPSPSPNRIVETRTIGRSVNGRSIVAYRLGTPGGTPVLAVGQIHGDEYGGTKVTQYLRNSASIPAGIDLWIIDTVNPDGGAAGRRGNAHGVDLNRNFNSGDWRAIGAGTEYYSGTGAASEPETKAVQNFLATIRPRLVVWWHQVGGHVDHNPSVANYSLLQGFANAVGYPIRTTSCGTPCLGTATAYTNRVVGGTAFVVEMPSAVGSTTAATQARGFLQMAQRA